MAISPGLLAQLYRLSCAAGAKKGTGTYHAPFNINSIATLILTEQGFEYEEALTNEYIQELQQRGKAFVFSKVSGLEVKTADDNLNTDATTGIITKAGTGLRAFDFTFKNGLYFDTAMRTFESFGKFDATYLDKNNSVIFTATEDYVKGFTLGQIWQKAYTAGNIANDAMSVLSIQEIYPDEFNKDVAWSTYCEHNIRNAKLDGVNDALVTIEAVPADGDVSIVFSVKTKADRNHVDLGGLLPANMEFLVNGTPRVFTGTTIPFDNASKKYTGSFTPQLDASDIVTLRLNDSAFTTGIVKKGGRLYFSNTATETVV